MKILMVDVSGYTGLGALAVAEALRHIDDSGKVIIVTGIEDDQLSMERELREILARRYGHFELKISEESWIFDSVDMASLLEACKRMPPGYVRDSLDWPYPAEKPFKKNKYLPEHMRHVRQKRSLRNHVSSSGAFFRS